MISSISTKQEYLPFHLNQIYATAQELGLNIVGYKAVLTVSDRNSFCGQGHIAHREQLEPFLKDEAQTVLSFLNHHGFQLFFDSYIGGIFKSQDQPLKEACMQHFHEAFGSILPSFKETVHALSQMNYDDALAAFEFSGASHHWLVFCADYFLDDISPLAQCSWGAQALHTYVASQQKQQKITSDEDWTAVKAAVKRYFPNDIHLFKGFPLFNQGSCQSIEDLFAPQDNERVISVKLNLNRVREQFEIDLWTNSIYCKSLEGLKNKILANPQCEALHFSIEHHFSSQAYQFSSLHLTVSSQSPFDVPLLKSVIVEYFSYCQGLNVDDYMEEKINVDVFLSHFMMKHQLSKEEGSRKMVKKL